LHWLTLAPEPELPDFSPDTKLVLGSLVERGAQFFHELVKRSRLLPSRVEQALAELAAQGWATADSFEGLRALLLPHEKRVPFADPSRKRHYKAVTSVEFAGRWSLLRDPIRPRQVQNTGGDGNAPEANPEMRDAAVELFARALLKRYGIVFRRLLERESFDVSWYELGRLYRRLEARGEIRGGYFVGGVSGEQFALPEAIGALRSIRKTEPTGELISISGADPLNLAGVLTPGPRVAAITSNRILLRDGAPVAAFESGQIISLEPAVQELNPAIERALCVGSLPTSLRAYYAHT
jgi:ATP-dependent Lhr-like helicase